MKNKIVLDIAQRIGMQHTPDSRYVNVYIDHQYNGMYLLTQKVSADGDSVIHNSEGTHENITGPYLLEVDARYEEEPVWFKTNIWDFDLVYGDMHYGHYPKLTQKTMWLKDNLEG